eukprot:2896382-Lingulodinium_polyedra.AAC.1
MAVATVVMAPTARFVCAPFEIESEIWRVQRGQRAWSEGCPYRGRGDAAVSQRWARGYLDAAA